MAKQHKIGSNQSMTAYDNGVTIYYSYFTPVAMNRNGKKFKTSQYYSRTTLKHITQMGFRDCENLLSEDQLKKLCETWRKQSLRSCKT